MGRRRLARWVGGVAIAALSLACGREAPLPDPLPLPTATAGPTLTELPLRALGAGPMSGVTEMLTDVIRDEAAWQAFWRRHDGSEPVPAVDFASEMVVVVVLQRSTGGYRVRLDGARVGGGSLVVTYTELAPGPDEVVIQVLTQPWAFAALPLRQEPVTFEAR